VQALYGINSILFYLFEKQPNAYTPQRMMACVRLAPMLGNTGLPTRLPTRWQLPNHSKGLRAISNMNEEKDNPSWPAFLIDLDLAFNEQRTEASGAPNKTGTKVFMSLGALYGDKHTFMHDLESFFWVLFWMCIHFNGPDDAERVVPEYEKWNFVSMNELFNIKSGIISEEDNFLRLANEHFTPYYQPLIGCVNQLRNVVFPDGKRARNENERLYSQMREVLREGRQDL
jgi:Fungal protein kinase